MKLPEKFVKEGLALAKEAILFGIPLEELDRDELLAACAKGWAAYNNKLEETIHSHEFLAEIHRARGVHSCSDPKCATCGNPWA